jgi:hypothetical protein
VATGKNKFKKNRIITKYKKKDPKPKFKVSAVPAKYPTLFQSD